MFIDPLNSIETEPTDRRLRRAGFFFLLKKCIACDLTGHNCFLRATFLHPFYGAVRSQASSWYTE
ncbi:hypothetical protein HM1_2810 [Heliomicrobium modesticaldum Ice1]|uniref:Uncharacterized protein n=1 Tax=Heliobacterium modesticaldum (strain ATCC 51547 / Ice1) TaxID=498761 RepID=B0TCF1_HELMI|nr:hypothetical protein HM1_2810 [Heliomicrobium modesticaldum Ice1]